jgi:hypothetical protein
MKRRGNRAPVSEGPHKTASPQSKAVEIGSQEQMFMPRMDFTSQDYLREPAKGFAKLRSGSAAA